MRKFLILVAGALVAACQQPPPPQREALFVVMPNADGSVGSVSVTGGGQTVVLNQPYAASEVRASQVAATPMTPVEANQVFAGAIAARPVLPAKFRLYFQRDSNQLTTESEAVYREVFANIRQRTVYEVEVIGHTDTTGPRSYNQTLSLQRADAIRDRMVREGLAAGGISTAGRGQLDLAVPTGDNVAQPLNRRVEITVR